MVLRHHWRSRQDRVRPLRTCETTSRYFPQRRIVQGRVIPSPKGQERPEDCPREPSPVGGRKSVIWNVGVGERWLGAIREIRGRHQALRAASCGGLRQLDARYKRLVTGPLGHKGTPRPSKDFVDSTDDKENTHPDSYIFTAQELSEWTREIHQMWDDYESLD